MEMKENLKDTRSLNVLKIFTLHIVHVRSAPVTHISYQVCHEHTRKNVSKCKLGNVYV